MNQSNFKFIIPQDPETTVWRYRSIDRLESILENQSLYFASIENLQENMDFREGTLPYANEKDWLDERERLIAQQGFSSEEAQQYREDTSRLYPLGTTGIINPHLPYLVANCWHVNKVESERMWKFYGADGVVIKTTYGRLIESIDDVKRKSLFGKDIRIYPSLMRYIKRVEQRIGYNPYSLNLWEIVFHKDEKFVWEREFRLAADLCPLQFDLPLDSDAWKYCRIDDEIPVFLKDLVANEGILIPVNLNTLIEIVVISPNAPSDLKQRVEDLLKTHNIDANVELSALRKLR